MNKNLMPEVAELLGVELGKRFVVKHGDHSFSARLTTRGLEVDCDSIIHPNIYLILTDMLRGFCEIKRPSWEPEQGETYYFPGVFIKDVLSATWSNDDLLGLTLKKLKMVYKTKEEAEVNYAKDYKKLTGKRLVR